MHLREPRRLAGLRIRPHSRSGIAPASLFREIPVWLNPLAARTAARYAGIQASSTERTILSRCVLPWFPLGRRATGGSLTRRRRDDSDVSPSAATHPVGRLQAEQN